MSKTLIDSPLQDSCIQYLKNLRSQIISAFEEFETDQKFEKKDWVHSTGGGGEMSILRGKVFEKAAVNWSAVSGEHFPLEDATGPFFATGVSLITHMSNPHAPTVHMNLRYLKTKNKEWFGGGYDLTPMGFFYEEDKEHFHRVTMETLNHYDVSLYPLFSAQAKEYFYIPHRQKERGVGGIFFDHYNTGNLEKDFDLWCGIGNSFLHTILPLYKKRTMQPYTNEEKEIQLKVRGHYVEFNLLYDRGTRFGFKSGGNPDAILCSLPPLVSW